MSYILNEKLYLRLIRQFLNSELDAETFCDKFSSLWRVDRDEEWSKVQNGSERSDLQLTEPFNRGDVSAEVFQQKWRELFGSESYEDLTALTDRIFTACDVFRDEPEAKYEIDEAQLLSEVKDHLAIYESAKSK